MLSLTKADMQRVCPRPARYPAQAKIWDAYVDAILSPEGLALLERYEITTERRWCYLIATWACETGGLTLVWENMNYDAARMVQIFSDKGITYPEAKTLAHNPYAIAERCYGIPYPGNVGCKRMADMLGNTQKGDGWRFRGCGITQLTGRYSHERAAKIVGCPLDEVEKPLNSMHGALIEWADKRCNAAIDREAVYGYDATLREVRRRINGGFNGLAIFRTYLATARRIWPSAEGPAQSDAIALGDSGPQVKEIQGWLAASGNPAGAIDGIFGSLTEKAVAGFQVSHGLPGTGRVDQKTRDELKAAAAAPPAAVTPGRALATKEDLKKQGSETVEKADKVENTGKVVVGTSVLGLADTIGGFGMIDSVFDQIEKVQAVASRSGSVFAALIQPRVLLTLIALYVGYRLFMWGRTINWRRLADYRSGANTAAHAAPGGQ